MTGNDLIELCRAIIKRQDLNTDLLLRFINQQRRLILRSNYLYKIQKWETDFEPQDGFVYTPTLKQARYVEWNPDPEDNVAVDFNTTNRPENGIRSNRKKKLFRLNTIQEAFEFIGNVDAIGEPMYYVVMQDGIKIIPAPPCGLINVYGEWYPQDFENTEDSLSQDDKLVRELSDVIAYFSCGEYFDFLEEPEKAELWRRKGQVLLDEYFREIKRQMTDDRNLFERDPFGNLHIGHGWRKNIGFVYDTDELTGGTPTSRYSDDYRDGH